jgi:3-phenylpropionate/trans-cinnamate dioxygenase ferredoxin reductase component
MNRIVVAGGSIAAVTAADALRQHGHEGEILVLSDEKYAPYVRPPLSKGVLKGTEALESVSIAPMDDSVELVLGARIISLDKNAKKLSLADGSSIGYDGLVVATGARARRLLGDGSQEMVLRDLDDALWLKARFAAARSVIIVGGGFLGMEIASTARILGLEVTVIDMLPHLVRQFGSFLAETMTAASVAQGVKLICAPEGITLVDEDPLTTVRTADGSSYSADLVITAVGDIPNTEWLASSGLGGPGGLDVDSRCRVAPNIVAAGDLVALPEHLAPTVGPRRTPHWGAAIDQARTAAAALLKGDAADPYKPAPYFWTEQWGLDIKICGRIVPGAVAETVEGSLDDHSALIQFSRDGAPIAAASVNHRIPLVKLRRLAAAMSQ